MNGEWVDRPRFQPYTDPLLQDGSKSNGPYFEFDFHYRPYNEVEYDERVYRLAFSAITLRDALRVPGSPYVAVAKDDYETLLREHHEAVERVIELEEELAASTGTDLETVLKEIRKLKPNRTGSRARA